MLRATTDPEWTDTVEVDTAGNRSPVSYPRASR
jgi:hypothetical protein